MTESGTCSNRNSVRLDRIQTAVLDGMREQLRDPRLIEAYVRTYNAERRRLVLEAMASRSKLENRLIAIALERQRVVDLVIRSVLKEDDAKRRLDQLTDEHAQIQAELIGPHRVVRLEC